MSKTKTPKPNAVQTPSETLDRIGVPHSSMLDAREAELEWLEHKRNQVMFEVAHELSQRFSVELLELACDMASPPLCAECQAA